MWDAIDAWGRRQHGLVMASQLAELGLSRSAWRHLVATGKLIPVRQGVYRIAGTPRTADQALLAAVLAAGDALVAHLSAAAFWTLRGFDQPEGIHLLSATAARLAAPGVVGHRTLWLPARDCTVRRGIPVTTPERSLVDASGGVSEVQLGRTVDDACRRGLIVLPRLIRTFEDVPPSGRRPSKAMRAVLRERVPGYEPGGSDEELDVVRTLRRHNRPLPQQQYRVVIEGRKFSLDFAFPDLRHCLEWQGETFHGAVSALHDDSARTRRLIRAGRTVWPLTKRMTAGELLAIVDHIHGYPISLVS